MVSSSSARDPELTVMEFPLDGLSSRMVLWSLLERLESNIGEGLPHSWSSFALRAWKVTGDGVDDPGELSIFAKE